MDYSIKIGGHIWKVEYVDEITVGKDMDADGISYYEKRLIQIATRDKDQEFINRILIHELTHAILATGGLHEMLDTKMEEAICVCMENNLLPLVTLRPGVLKPKGGKKK